MPEPLAEAIREGNELFVHRVSPTLVEGGRFFCNGLLSVLEQKVNAKGRPRRADLAAWVEHALGLAPTPSAPIAPIAPVAPGAPSAGLEPRPNVAPAPLAEPRQPAALVVPVESMFGAATLSFFDRVFVLEREGFAGAKERTELAYADLEELRLARGPSGCELSVRVRYSEQRFTLKPADALTVARGLLPYVARS